MAQPAHAQEETVPDASRGEKPWELTDQELSERGWEVRGQGRAPGSVGCGLAAIVVSLAWRGWGHRCANDEESHIELLIIEGVAVGLLASGVTIAMLSNDADALNPVWTGLFYAGTVLFVSSYLFDLLGTFKGGSRPLNRNRQHDEGITPRGLFRLALNDPFDLNVIVGLEAPMRYGWFMFTPKALIEATSVDFWQLGGELAGRVWQGDESATFFAVGSETRYESFAALGFNVLTTVPYVELSIDVGTALGHLRGMFFSNRIGYGFEFYDWSTQSGSDFTDTSSIFVLESELSMNILETINLAVTYRQRPDLLVGGLARAGRIGGVVPTPGIGVLGFDLDFDVGESGWDAYAEVNLGTLVEFWLGFGRSL